MPTGAGQIAAEIGCPVLSEPPEYVASRAGQRFGDTRQSKPTVEPYGVERGQPEALLTKANERKKTQKTATGNPETVWLLVCLVAGTGFEPVTFRL